ncbi:Uncharacterised protein [uncultured archaeon]|nr:Uncharacterised protein [uncultured archaeon]
MVRPDDAKERYERALEMREALLKTDPENTNYISGVVRTTLTLGQNIIIIGDLKERKDSLQYFDEAYRILNKKAEQFNNIGLKYESFLAFRLGLLSKLKYNARVIELEKTATKRAAGYRECAKLASRLADIETEEEQKKKWSDTALYYEGRALVNDSINENFNREKLFEAVNKFKQATSCDEAFPCYCVYDALIKIRELTTNERDLRSLKQYLSRTRQKMSKGEATKACFLKIEQAIEKVHKGEDIDDLIKEINEIILNMDHSGLKEHFNYAVKSIDEYYKNPMIVEIKFQNWQLWGTISGMNGTVRIIVKGDVLWEEMIDKQKNFNIPFEPENLHEDIIFESLENPHHIRKKTLDFCELIDGNRVFFLKRRAM